jgi:alpha-tubulin suppressor-like RCC1 family protein
MKPKLLFLLLPIVLNSSCSLVSYRQQTIEKTIAKHSRDISHTDTTKINLNGVYLFKFNWEYNSKYYIYLIFYPNGKVYRSKPFGKVQKRKDIEALNNGDWFVYWTKKDNIYIEYGNKYNGVLLIGHFSEDYKRVVFTGTRIQKTRFNIFRGQIIFKQSETLELEE